MLLLAVGLCCHHYRAIVPSSHRTIMPLSFMPSYHRAIVQSIHCIILCAIDPLYHQAIVPLSHCAIQSWSSLKLRLNQNEGMAEKGGDEEEKLRLMVKNCTIITSGHVESALILLEQGFVRAFRGSLQKGLTNFHDPIEWHQLHDAVRFNKNAR